MTIRIMVDIETLSTKPNAVILSLGTVVIGNTLEVIPEFSYYKVFNRNGQKERHIDINTVEFWMKNISMYPIATENSSFLSDSLWQFNSWLGEVSKSLETNLNEIEFWAKGSDFDFVILKDAYESFCIPVPWAYNAVRDLRSILKWVPKTCYTPKEENKEAHNALGDAKFQAMQLIQALKYRQEQLDG